MGKDIHGNELGQGITLNVYTHLKLDDAREELKRVGL